MVLQIKKNRKEELLESIESILKGGDARPRNRRQAQGQADVRCEPVLGQSGKARLGEAVHMKDMDADRTCLNEPLIRSLEMEEAHSQRTAKGDLPKV